MNYYSYKTCIDACFQCAAICYYCADADKKEGHDMPNCARINMECAIMCTELPRCFAWELPAQKS
ncbi:MAG: hypothetical protein ACXVP0_05525 [Bacteroidia bacterium]